jgi:hypothetical protein
MAILTIKWSKKYKIVGDINFFRCMAKNGKRRKMAKKPQIMYDLANFIWF